MLKTICNNLWLLRNCKDWQTILAMKGKAGTHLSLRGLDHPVLFRPGTTDISVAWELFHNGEYEVECEWPFRTIVDCGANSGMFMAWVLKQSGNRFSRYVGIEADGDSFQELERQALSLLPDATLFKAAIWAQDGQVNFDSSGPSWAHRVSIVGEEVVRAMRLQTILDEAQLPYCDLLKLDIEGGEEQVLPAIMATCADRVETMVVELHNGLDYDWFRKTVEPSGFIAREPRTLFRAHPGAVRIGSRFEQFLL